MSIKITTKKFVGRSTKIHKGKYNYTHVKYEGCFKKVCIKCPEHGNFFQLASTHLQGSGCPKCKHNTQWGSDKCRAEKFFIKVKKIHNGIYDYKKSKYKNIYSKIEIVCPTHGSFWQRPYNHLKNKCTYCAKNFKLNRRNFILKSNEIHKNKYNYSLIDYKNIRTKVCIKCPEHGNFFQFPDSHLRGKGCPKCSYTISKPETKFLDYLKIKNRNVYVKPFKVDGINYKTNTIYEFLGDYWHGNPEKYKAKNINHHNKKSFGKLYKDTLKKFDRLKNMGYNIKYIWENDWKKFKKFPNKKLKIYDF